MKHNLCHLRTKLSSLVSTLVIASMVIAPGTAIAASSWNPTLLVNTEAFQTIDDGDGSTNIELRFGDTGSGLILNVTENQFEFDTDLEVQGTASGRVIHAQDKLTTSGSLVIDEGQTISINGVEYLFPASDGTNGFVLTTDSSGNLSWTNKTAGSLTESSGDDRYINQSGDTMTGALIIDVEGGDLNTSALQVSGTLSGQNVHATSALTSSGQLTIEGEATFNDEATFGSGLIINGVTYRFPFGDGSASGKVLKTDGNGNLSWSDDTDTSQQTTFTLTADGGSDQTIAQGNSLDIAGGDEITTAVGDTDTVTINITDNTIDFTEIESALELDTDTTLTFGTSDFVFNLDNSGDFEIQDGGSTVFFVDGENGRVGINTSTADTDLEVVGTASGTIFRALDELSSSGTLAVEGNAFFGGNITTSITSCTLLTTNSDGQLVCDSEGLDESVDDQVASLLQAGTGVTIEYDDTGGTLTISQGFSSGAQVSLSPEYAGAVYYGDGSNNVGQLQLAYDSSNAENYYQWTSTQSALNDYNISVRVKVPEDFDHWDGTAPIQFRYRTNAASSDDNQIDITMLDTAGASVALTGAADLANTSWTTATITGPEGTGTYTPGSYITLIIAMQARTTNSGEAHAGFLNINWHTEP